MEKTQQSTTDENVVLLLMCTINMLKTNYTSTTVLFAVVLMCILAICVHLSFFPLLKTPGARLKVACWVCWRVFFQFKSFACIIFIYSLWLPVAHFADSLCYQQILNAIMLTGRAGREDRLCKFEFLWARKHFM